LTRTSSERTPCSFAAVPAACAAVCAANGVPLREPLNPCTPADDQESTFPFGSVIVTIVLLNDAWMFATPWGMFFRSFLPPFFPGAFAALAMRQPHHSLALLPGRFLLAGDRSTRPATGPRVGVRALPPAGEVASMAHPAVRADLDQPLDVEPDALAQ